MSNKLVSVLGASVSGTLVLGLFAFASTTAGCGSSGGGSGSSGVGSGSSGVGAEAAASGSGSSGVGSGSSSGGSGSSGGGSERRKAVARATSPLPPISLRRARACATRKRPATRPRQRSSWRSA